MQRQDEEDCRGRRILGPMQAQRNRMKICIVSCLFLPEPIVSSHTSADLAEQLRGSGHRVRVITSFPSRPNGKLYEGYKRRLWLYDRSFSRYDVLRCFSVVSPASSLLSRFLENISFGITSGLAVLSLEKPDVIYGNTWPIFAQGILALACRMRGIPLIMSVQDIYPESLAVQGRMRNRRFWIFRFLRWLDTKAKKNSAALVVVSEQFRRIYLHDRGLPAENVHLVPNWFDENRLQIDPNDHLIRSRHAIPEDAFLVVYGGNLGAASGVDTVISAFQDLMEQPNIYLLVAGGGSNLLAWRQLARELGNPRIIFHTPWLDSETSSVLAAPNLFILPTHGDQSLVSVPSKLMAYMLAGRPILCAANRESDIARTIAAADCGWVIPSEDPGVMAQRVLALSQRPSCELSAMGQRGRDYAIKFMTKSANLGKLVNLILSIAEQEPIPKVRVPAKDNPR